MDAELEANHELAREHTRHLDIVVLTTLGFVSALAIGSLVIIGSIEQIRASPILLGPSYACYAATALYGYLALRSNSALVPNPNRSETTCRHSPPCGSDPAAICLRIAIEQNRRRRSYLRGIWRWAFSALLLLVLSITLPDLWFEDEPRASPEFVILFISVAAVINFVVMGVRTRYTDSAEIIAEARNHMECGLVLSLEGEHYEPRAWWRLNRNRR